jgi:hypothetical protein
VVLLPVPSRTLPFPSARRPPALAGAARRALSTLPLLSALFTAVALTACVAPPATPPANAAPSTAATSSSSRAARPAGASGVASSASSSTAETPPPVPRVMPVEAEPVAPATQAALAFVPRGFGPVDAMLFYADRLRPLGASDLAAELVRLGDPGDSPTAQMHVALVLAQTRAPADLARALALMQRVGANAAPEAQPLQPLARVLATRYLDQRRIEDDRDRQVQQLRESQRRIEQLNDRLEALRAIERSFSRPNHVLPSNGSGRPGPAQ